MVIFSVAVIKVDISFIKGMQVEPSLTLKKRENPQITGNKYMEKQRKYMNK